MVLAKEVNNRPLEATLYGHLGERLLEWEDFTGARDALAHGERMMIGTGDQYRADPRAG